ncbi:MAG: hypothetical protein HOE80_04925, partial [Candidatus Magasanikbacteria bacterium]|nr:hypothetical protein [Candidatus Magasanikbacteria bacterium]
MKHKGERFIHQREPRLHTTHPVELEQTRKKRHPDETATQKPADKLSDWFDVLERTHLGHTDNPKVIKRLKDYYKKEHVISTDEVPERYFDLQKQIAREEGHGDIEIGERQRTEMIENIQTDQKASLDMWTEYFLSEDSSSFPMWAKYWAYKGMLKLGKYNKEKESFEKRTKSTTSPFIDLNREALALVVDSIIKKVNKEEISEDINTEEFKKLLQGSNFGKLYAYAIEKVTPAEEGELLNTKGEWITYKQGSDHMPLVNSLQGKGTGWCTAGESTAKSQLTSGDFHV